MKMAVFQNTTQMPFIRARNSCQMGSSGPGSAVIQRHTENDQGVISRAMARRALQNLNLSSTSCMA